MERNSAIKAQIQEELRWLEDEITACKWTQGHTQTVPNVLILCCKYVLNIQSILSEEVCVLFVFHQCCHPIVLFCNGE